MNAHSFERLGNTQLRCMSCSRLLLAFMLALVGWQQQSWAVSSGIAGRTNRDGGFGCTGGGCHSDQPADAGMSVVISGPASLFPGADGVYTVTSTKASLGAGVKMGVDIAASDAGNPLSESAANLIISGNEIVHSQPSGALNTTSAGGSASYSFTYTMPAGAAPGSTHTLYATSRLGFSGAWNHAANFTVTTATPVPVITSSSASSGAVGVFLSYAITATNSPTSFDASGLAPGLTRSGAVISGTPTTSGTFNATISATNAGGTDTNGLTFNIARGNQTITFPVQDVPARTFLSGGTFFVSPVATASSGLAVVYSSATPGVCSVSGTTVTMVTLGTCTINAGQAGNANYFAAPTVGRSVQLTNTAQFITHTNPIAVGSSHSCARRTNGTVACWGDNEFGRVGGPIGGARAITAPILVSGLSGVASLALGNEHSCALTNAGAVQCWGAGSLGQLGNGANSSTPNPVTVSNISSSAAAISTGGAFTCAVTVGGGVKCWGDNQFGTLGNGSVAASSNVPVDVSGISNAVAVAGGANHACVLRADSTVACWGSNAFGQLGVPTAQTTQSNVPVVVTTFDVPAIAISAGSSHTCALTARRGVKCWGVNLSGELGNGTTSGFAANGAADVVGLTSGVAAISAGNGATCARLDNGTLQCWGRNANGQLGDGTTTQRLTPVTVNNLAAPTIAETGAAVASGGLHTCALTTSGRVRCWGLNNWGQLGNRTQTNSSAPVDALGLETIFASDTFSPNDDFANRTVISGRLLSVSTSNVVATDEASEPLHAGTSGIRSVWWSWTAPESRRFTINTVGSTSSGATPLNTALAVYTGTTLATLAPVVSGAAAGGPLGTWSEVSFETVAGTTYQIAVDRASSGFGGRVVLNISPEAAVVVDLSGDGKSDVLLQDGSGTVSARLVDGTNVGIPAVLIGAGSGWTVSHTADFNGDGKADLLWRHTDGSAAVWLMNGTSLVSGTGLLGPGSGWTLTHTADFNGDSKDDILLRHTDGRIAVWLMNGISISQGAILQGAGGPWTITHTGDLNGDGKADLLWSHTDGSSAVWLMNGTTPLSSSGLIGPGGWRLTVVADLNGDGKSDLVWRNTDGTLAAWLMNGATLISGTGYFGPGNLWTVTHAGDLDGDGKADLLLSYPDGTVVGWLMNGLTITAGAVLMPAGTGWLVQGVRDFNGDGKADLIWRNEAGAATGTTALWLMNGFTISAGGSLTGPGPTRVVP